VVHLKGTVYCTLQYQAAEICLNLCVPCSAFKFELGKPPIMPAGVNVTMHCSMHLIDFSKSSIVFEVGSHLQLRDCAGADLQFYWMHTCKCSASHTKKLFWVQILVNIAIHACVLFHLQACEHETGHLCCVSLPQFLKWNDATAHASTDWSSCSFQ
jgi:hypothetical protein